VFLGLEAAGHEAYIRPARGPGDPARVAGRPGDLQRRPGLPGHLCRSTRRIRV
jgi:hypothetical protein